MNGVFILTNSTSVGAGLPIIQFQNVRRVEKMVSNIFPPFDLKDVVNLYLGDIFPYDIARLVLEYSAHLKIGRTSVSYVLYF